MADNDNENKCPLCGKNTTEGETFCRDCQEIAQNAYPDELLTNHEIEEILESEGEDLIEAEEQSKDDGAPSQEIGKTEGLIDKPVKSNKGLYIFFGICLGLLIAAGIYSSFNYVEKRNREGAENNYWNKCIEENTPLAYSKYLVQYPDGKYSVEAGNKIRELRESEQKEWKNLRNSNNIDALFAFLTDHPETPYTREIRHAIDSLIWIATSKDNTAAAYQAYLDNVKLGRYPGEYQELAQQKYDYISQLKTVEGEDLKGVKVLLDNFFKSLSSLNDKDMAKVVPDTIVKFYSSLDKTPKYVIDSLKKDIKSRKIKSVVYSYQSDLLEAIEDGKGICFISIPVVEEFTYTDKKKKKDAIKYNVKMELTDRKLVGSIYKEIKAKN